MIYNSKDGEITTSIHKCNPVRALYDHKTNEREDLKLEIFAHDSGKFTVAITLHNNVTYYAIKTNDPEIIKCLDEGVSDEIIYVIRNGRVQEQKLSVNAIALKGKTEIQWIFAVGKLIFWKAFGYNYDEDNDELFLYLRRIFQNLVEGYAPELSEQFRWHKALDEIVQVFRQVNSNNMYIISNEFYDRVAAAPNTRWKKAENKWITSQGRLSTFLAGLCALHVNGLNMIEIRNEDATKLINSFHIYYQAELMFYTGRKAIFNG
jgi:hypothetical protein